MAAGDGLVREPTWQATRAITIHAPGDAVWPWLVQMGYPTHRAGWYIPLWMDRLLFGIRTPSADRIVPELQDLAPGDRVPDSPDATASYFTAAEVVDNRALVLLSHTHPLPIYRDVEFSWAFVLGRPWHRNAAADACTRQLHPGWSRRDRSIPGGSCFRRRRRHPGRRNAQGDQGAGGVLRLPRRGSGLSRAGCRRAKAVLLIAPA